MSGYAENTVGQVLMVDGELEREQIVDIIVSYCSTEDAANKHEAVRKVTSQWSDSDWKTAMRKYYASYKKARFGKLLLPEVCPGIAEPMAIKSMKDIDNYKSAPDAYYVYKACKAGFDSRIGTAISDYSTIMAVVYATLELGENYPTACFPPQIFLDRVCRGISNSDYYATCLYVMSMNESFENISITCAQQHPEIVKKAKRAYKELFSIDAASRIQKAQGVAASVASRMYTPPPPPQPQPGFVQPPTHPGYAAPPPPITGAMPVGGNFIGKFRARIFAPYWLIMLLINIIATPMKFYINSGYTTALSQDHAGLIKILLACIISFITGLIPILGIVSIIVMKVGKTIRLPGIFALITYTSAFIAVGCTVYSAMIILRFAISFLAAVIAGQYNSAGVARYAIKGVFGSSKGLAGAIHNRIAGWFKR